MSETVEWTQAIRDTTKMAGSVHHERQDGKHIQDAPFAHERDGRGEVE
jgi:hypothetical protein